MTKKCTKCGGVKDETEFGWKTQKHKKRLAACKICTHKRAARWVKRNQDKCTIYHRRAEEKRKKQDPVGYERNRHNSQLRTIYGISLKQYEIMLAAQNGVCAICGRPETAVRKGKLKNLAVDHNRETAEVRGLLCLFCNVGLGYFKHNSDRLRKAAAYLEYHSTGG